MSSKFGAYTGKVIKINLTNKTVEEYPFSDEDRELYLGGKIMAAKILYDNILKPIDPLSEENMIVISTGPLSLMGSPCSSRFNISSISPLTKICCSSNCGGNFGLSMKRAGYDAIIIVGKADEKTYISLNNEIVEFKNADSIWGLETEKAQLALGAKGGKLVIGPAGENLVKYACAVSQDRVAGRGGLGSVFGSKNLKGLVAFGSNPPSPKDKDRLAKVNKVWVERLKSHAITGKQLPKLGTAGLLSTMNTRKILATKNFSAGQYEDFEKISGEELALNHLVKNKGCITCPIQCARVVRVNNKDVKGPEVETLGLFGANILNNDIVKINEWNYLLDELGLDSISTAGTIAFAMELNEKGLRKSELEFGKNDNIAKIIHDIAYRVGEGEELAEGSQFLADKYGGQDFCINVKGMELSAYEPRSAVGQGLGYAISNRGGCHLNAGYLVVLEGLGMTIDPYTPSGKAELTMTFQDLMEAVSAAGNCLFTTYAFFPKFLIDKPNLGITRFVNKAFTCVGGVLRFARKNSTMLAVNLPHMLPHPLAIKYSTGMNMNFGKFRRIGERGYVLERLLNLRLGLDTKKDTLPKRLTEVLQDEKNPKSKVPIELLVKRYYKARGWDENGVPKSSLIKKLKIEVKLL